jgi:hypothetical protein
MQQSRKGEVLRNATNIRKNLAAAIENGDEASAREWLQRARSFDDSNPGYAVLPGLPGVLRQRAKARAMADLTGLPAGTNLRDPGAQELTRFANY